MEHPQNPFEKKDSSGKSLNELAQLLLELNAKLREKIPPPRKKERTPDQTDIVIIILTNREERAPKTKFSKPVKAEFPPGDWLENMFAEIEERKFKRRKNP
jgi:hypothetical protein